MAALTNARHEKYVQNLIAGMSQRKAYRDAFPQSNKWKDETVDVKASHLFAEDKIRTRYQEILEEQKNDALLSRYEKRKTLADIVKAPESTPAEIIRAIDLDNRMEGEYANNINLNIESSQKFDDIIAQLGGEGLEE